MSEKVVYVENAVANVFKDGTIELHKDLQLPKYDKLREKILNHEKAHDFSKGFWYNFKVELTKSVSTFQIIGFMISRPRTWIQVLPVYYTKKDGLVYDKNMILNWVVIGILIFLIIKFAGGI